MRLPKEKGTEKGKGFAYVEFNSHISHRVSLKILFLDVENISCYNRLFKYQKVMALGQN